MTKKREQGTFILEWLTNTGEHTITALRFFTRLPIPDRPSLQGSKFPKLNDAAIGFPIAGLIIALFPALIWVLTAQFLPTSISAILAIATGTLITGALHEDGLADCADGLGGATNAGRALEIMRDSTIGTYGASALMFSFALRIAALAALPIWQGVIALLIAHTAARAAIVIAITHTNYARDNGLGDSVKNGTDKNQLYATLAITAAIAFTLAVASGQYFILLAPVAGLGAAWATMQYVKSRIGGYTGDSLGAMEQVAEITIMVILAGIWS